MTLWSNSFASQKTQRILRLFDDLEEVIISVSNSIKPSVVHIEVVKKSESFKYKSLASGLIVDKDGLILTNEHVVDKAQSITVTLASKLEYSAELIGTDKLTDLALIKIKTGENLIVANLGDSEKVEVGEWVIAVGNPYGFDRTVSFGIISGIGRVLPNLPVEIQPINEFIQTDAAIDPGSSGGPLVNLKGEVIGINSVWVGRGQGFTIPINTAIEVKDKLLLSGTIERGWIGIEIQPLNRDLARYFEDEGLEGIIVSDVEPDSPAEASGLLSGDIIIEYQGERVKAEKDEDLNKFNLLISQTKPEDKAKLKIKRGENLIEMEVEIGQKPKVKPDEYETDLGFTVEEITDAMYKRYRLEDRVGVIVSYVEVGSPASKGELSESDVIIKIEDLSIETLDDFKDALEKLDNRDQFLLTVKRGKNKRFVLIIKEEEKEQQ
ncbi:MAG: hypothetical protein AMJ90_02485 [candidate division Zixibacteria bacterium SM23_73_2]|nr:MAG: hypothetical protein AMJ90_02485 [candidate division Zixibacteria bacterium SM23_73_2]